MRKDVIYALLTCFVAFVGLAISGLVYINHVQDQGDRRNAARAREICGLIVVLDDAYRQNPPTTELGRHIAAEMHTYRVGLGC